MAVAMTVLPVARAEKKGGAALDTAKIEELTGVKGKLDDKEGVFKVSMPRPEVAATASGVKITPALGLTAWAAFMRAGAHVMTMGDMVVLEDQVNPVMSAALDNGLEVTALHNHFFWDSPKVMFMHIGGMGDETTLATAVGKVFATIKRLPGGRGRSRRPTSTPPRAPSTPRRSTPSWATRASWPTGSTR